MINRHRKLSHSLQRKRIINRQKLKINNRRNAQFISESSSTTQSSEA